MAASVNQVLVRVARWTREGRTLTLPLSVIIALAYSHASAQAPQTPEVRVDRFGDRLPEGALLRLGTHRYRTEGIILHAALSPDGRRLATASPSGITLFNIDTGKSRPLRDAATPEFFDTNGSFLAFSPDGKQLVNVTRGGNLHFWDVATGKQLRVVGNNPEPDRGQGWFPFGQLPAGSTHYSKVWFPPKGEEVVAGTPDYFVCFIAPSTGKILRRFRAAGQLASITANGKSLAVIDDMHHEVVLYDNLGKEMRRFHDGSKIDPATLCQGGKRLVTFNDKSELKIWDVATGKLQRAIAVSNPKGDVGMRFVTAVAISPDGNSLFAGTREGPILRWNLRTGTEQAPLRGHAHLVTGLFPHAEQQSLFSVSWDQVIRRWKLPNGEAEAGSKGFTGPFLVALSPDGRIIATTSYPGRLKFWDVASGKRRQSHPLPVDSIYRLRFAPDGKLLALACSDLRIRLWDVDKGRVAREIKPPPFKEPGSIGFEDMLWSPDGRYLAVSYLGNEKGTWLWETATGKRVWHSDQTGRLAFAPDGKTLVRCGWDENLTFQDAATGQVRFVLQGSRKFEWSVAFSPDGSVLATNHPDGNLCLRDPATGKPRKILPIEHIFPRTISFSPDGKWLASGARDGGVSIWEVATATKVFSLKGHRELVSHMEFGTDGRTILTASGDMTALLWSLHASPELGRKRPLETLWTDLAGEPATAYCALWEFTDDPNAATKFLRKKIAPVKINADEGRVRALLDDLGNDEFLKREAATRALAAMGVAMEGRLRRTLADAESAEVQRRIRSLLDNLKREPTGEDYRLRRAVQVLELCGTADAQDVLRAWAGGVSGAPFTEQAKAALKRSDKRR